MADENDLQHLVERVDHICDAKSEVGVGMDADVVSGAERIRAEVEWFVQHVAERISAADARLIWGPVLEAAKAFDIAFATTNYDRAIELAANAAQIRLDDGFEVGDTVEASRWNGFRLNGTDVPLIKLHGSTDWYARQGSGDPVKLRHPMPLFGDAVLTFGDRALESALVLPSREKMLTRDPYPRLSQKFLNTADMCDLALFVGSSLRDSHILGAARSLGERGAVVIVNPDGDGRGISDALVLTQSASRFLVSTLPNALTKDDLEATLDKLRMSTAGSEMGPYDGIIDEIRVALDEEMTSVERCQAIDALVRGGATMPVDWIGQLLNGYDADVARYALGLVVRSSRREELMNIAQSCKNKANASFADELELLNRLVET